MLHWIANKIEIIGQSKFSTKKPKSDESLRFSQIFIQRVDNESNELQFDSTSSIKAI